MVIIRVYLTIITLPWMRMNLVLAAEINESVVSLVHHSYLLDSLIL